MKRNNETTLKIKKKRISYVVTSSFRYFVKKKGFTIIEMLTVTMIIGILMAMGGRMYYEERNRFEYNNALSKMMEMIKTARNSATTSRPVVNPATGKNEVPKSGYGVHIELDPPGSDPHLILFASYPDIDGDLNTYNLAFKKKPDPKASKILEEYRLQRETPAQRDQRGPRSVENRSRQDGGRSRGGESSTDTRRS